jgi:signal transduction histidine kinase
MTGLSLRRSFLGLWLGCTVVAIAVAGLTVVVFERSSAALVAKGRTTAAQACAAAGARYRLLAASGSAADTLSGQNRDLTVIMQASLYQFPGVEGSLWRKEGGFFGYAYPTYEGPTAKTDLPAAEREHIEELVALAVREQAPRIDERRGLREVVITAACPIDPKQQPGLAAWTLLRVSLGPSQGFDYLTLAGALLLAFLVGSGLWVARKGLRWSRAFAGVERALEGAATDAPRDIAPTGLAELDRVVEALNRFGRRLDEARAETAVLTAKASQVDRLAALGRMAAGLAHEIRNPVAAMRLKAENALAGPQPRHAAALQSILGQIGRLDRLLAEMLAFAQPIALCQQPVPLKAYVDDRIEALRERAEVAGVSLQGHADGASCTFDPEQMSRAIDNLLINALRHAPAGGRVELTAAVAHATLTFTVADTGPGVDPTIAARLFEPFATSRADGVGLGLSIVREIAAAHGGTVELVPGDVGAVFAIRLPCRPS